MINNELKRLSRKELVDIIYQMKQNEQKMQEEMAALNEELRDRRIKIAAAGSSADASVSITNIFSAAQMTADLYVREIACMKEDAQKECEKIIKEAKQEAERIISLAKLSNSGGNDGGENG